MSEFRITGIWKNKDGVITHYAIHERTKNSDGSFTLGYAKKVEKDDAVDLLLLKGNSAKTYLWNYSTSSWLSGADVHVIEGEPLYLRTEADSTEKDNLSHLINYGFIFR
ncbi:DUF3892 domain-containing protein [Epilithonimonas sp.]|uniref:DUF3892 domain-containing protein n=1 Tax=Epilithonimonas sp. TaxID=2894511 RepID=UPI0028996F77|nr:DUF3892 domain-containing protein [Epilithonimonas sp.]